MHWTDIYCHGTALANNVTVKDYIQSDFKDRAEAPTCATMGTSTF